MICTGYIPIPANMVDNWRCRNNDIHTRTVWRTGRLEKHFAFEIIRNRFELWVSKEIGQVPLMTIAEGVEIWRNAPCVVQEETIIRSGNYPPPFIRRCTVCKGDNCADCFIVDLSAIQKNSMSNQI